MESFRQALAGVFHLDGGDGAPFSGEIRFQATRRFALLHLEASPALFRQTIGPSPEAAAIVRVRYGAIETRIAGVACRLGTGGLFLLDPAEAFQFRPLERVALDCLWSNRSAWRERLVAESNWHGHAIDPDAASATVLGAALEDFAGAVGRAGVGETDALAAGLLDLAARAANFRLSPPGRRLAADPEATLAKARRFVDRNLSSPKLDLAMIARAFGISRASLYRLFAPIGGVATYVRKQRLAHARRALASPSSADRRIRDVAHDAGFRSLGAFNRLFLAEYGLTPSEARAEAVRETDGALRATGDLATRLRDLI